jgi:hypothetical protein
MEWDEDEEKEVEVTNRYGFMWVGKEYTPASFGKEAAEMGVSKRIHKLPKGLVLGKTWIMLAHREVPIYKGHFGENGLAKQEPEFKPAIFYGFQPTRIEKLIWKSQATPKRLKRLQNKGITPVIIPDGDEDHMGGKKK